MADYRNVAAQAAGCLGPGYPTPGKVYVDKELDRNSPITDEASSLYATAVSLGDMVRQLEDRLIPVCAPSPPTAETNQPPPLIACELHGRLLDLNQRLKDTYLRMRDLTERVRI